MRSETSRHAGPAGVLGGLLWALTPLRQPIFGAGGAPDEGELAFRVYNLLLVAVFVLLTVALLRLRHSPLVSDRLSVAGWWTVLVGHLGVIAGCLPAVLLGGAVEGLVMRGQDLAFFGAMVAALGALLVGISAVRRRARPLIASWLLLLTLPAGLAVLALLDALGTPEDYLGLPLTVLYGAAWVVLGWSWTRQPDTSSPGSSPARQQ